MTSYIPKPTLDSSYLDPAQQLESVLIFWKSSKNPRYLGDRRCNRSWRLINDQLVTNSHKCYHKSVLKLHDRPLYVSPPSHQVMIKNRPSLFSNYSKSTAVSNLSLRSPSKQVSDVDSGDDTSDLSEDGEYSGSDCDSIHLMSSKSANTDHTDTRPDAQSWKNNDVHRLAKSAISSAVDSEAMKSNIFFISNSPSSPKPLNRNASRSSLSHEDSCQNEVAHTDKLPFAASPSAGKRDANLQRQDSLFGARPHMGSAHLDPTSSASSSDISEDEEFDSEDAEDIDAADPGVSHIGATHPGKDCAKNVTLDKIPRSSEDNDSEWLSASSDADSQMESPKQDPISFAKKIPLSHPSNSTLCESPASSETGKGSIKRRSLLSGLFSNGANGFTPSGETSCKDVDASENSKPVLKRSSTTGVITVEEVAKNEKMGSKPSILYSKRYASLSDIPRRLPPQRSPVTFPVNTQNNTYSRLPNSQRQDPLFAKQTSQVGVSNLMVLAEGTGSPKSRNISHNPKVKSAENISLSSSLSKYSSSLNHPTSTSLKNLLSNSAINISSILGHGFSNKLRPSRQNRSSEALKTSEEDLSSSFAGYLSRQHSQESTRTDIPLSHSVRVTASKDFEPSVEISKSLKDSLMIDHKLGKRPMPERVISDEGLFLGYDGGSFLQDENDYHSKGW